ncbi:DEAD/DEAH box helicase [Limnohabitans sp. 103DPR2]|uniref:DEAD/DEAH box helicase n=1 Tax=Limnohabitans sp. 103DPR2 TaxID=1678129 RepID=UPI0006DCBE14|nr:DEAD/DEAH box helicase [Limnohabitans sp. 103DPR2]ALK92744.1 ATP-dependent RNA helicase RhlE [Limnohabitans sp. 103DPR2]
MSFNDLGLSPELLRALKPKTYPAPTPVQQEFIPAALTGQDIWVTAPTGSGKTVAYALPLIEKLTRSDPSQSIQEGRNQRALQSLVLVPTRELAIQVGQTFMSLSAHLGKLCKVTVVFGGVSINPQMMGLRGGTDILIATPGRLLDLLDHNALKLSQVQTLVLDEADKLLELGFQDELGQILAKLPHKRQNLFLSATRPNSIESLAQSLLHNPLEIQIESTTLQPAVIAQRAFYTDTPQRTQLLKHLIKTDHLKQLLVFVATQHSSEIVAAKLRVAGIAAEPFHGQLSQGKRQQVLADFKAHRVKVVLATDLAARGLDIEKLPAVVNYDLPRSAVDYTHRIGRTGRAGEAGLAISFVCPETLHHWNLIEKRHNVKLALETIQGFEATQAVPEQGSANGGIKGKRPSKKDKLRQMAASAKPS